MALKDDLKGVKQQIGAEEQFLENIIKSEIFIRKYKIPIIALFAILLVGFIGFYANKFYQSKRIESANILYDELLKNPNDETKKEQLKNKDLNLYALFEFANLSKNNNSEKLDELANLSNLNPVLKEIINLQNGKSSGEMLGDYTLFINGYKLLKSGKLQEAKSEFEKISLDSQFKNIAQDLIRYNG